MKTHSIVTRLSIWIALSLACTSLLIFITARSFLSKQLQQRDRRYIWQEAIEYSNTFVEGGLQAVIRQYGEERRDSEDLALYLRIISSTGDTLFEESHHSWFKYDLDEFRKLKGVLAEGWHVAGKKAELNNTQLDIIGTAIPSGEIVQVGMSSYFRDELLEDFTSLFWMFAGIAFLFSSLVGILVARSSLRPLLQFKDDLKRLSESGDINSEPPSRLSSNYREIAELSEFFNALIGKINRLLSSMRDGLDTIAHETKTPLTRLRINAERALLRGDEKEKEESLTLAIEETDRLSRIINAIIEVASANGKFFKLSKRNFDLSEAIKKVVTLYEDTALEKQISLEIKSADAVHVKADFEQLVQAISNIVDNAIKFTPNGGAISLSTGSDNRWAIVAVRDNGIGIPQDEIPLIWQRLFRGKSSSHKSGLGLGLALVDAIVKSHGGMVSVESKYNEGSVFKISLPLS